MDSPTMLSAPSQKPAEVVTQALPKVLIKVPRNTKIFLDAKAGEWTIHGSHTDMQATFGNDYQDDVHKFKVNCHNSNERLKLKLRGNLNPDHSGSNTWKFDTPPWKFENYSSLVLVELDKYMPIYSNGSGNCRLNST